MRKGLPSTEKEKVKVPSTKLNYRGIKLYMKLNRYTWYSLPASYSFRPWPSN
jgi:hypothetical protein